MKNFLALVLRRYDQQIKTVRLDRETSLGNAFNAWTAEKGITIERSAPYMPAQNGAAERSGKELIQKARAMRIGSNMPEELWPETVKMAGYLLNRTPRRRAVVRPPTGFWMPRICPQTQDSANSKNGGLCLHWIL
jgi:hypothetical protein